MLARRRDFFADTVLLLTGSRLFYGQHFLAKILCKFFDVLHGFAYTTACSIVSIVKLANIRFSFCDLLFDFVKDFAHNCI